MDNKIYLELAPISRREYILFHIMLVVLAIAMVLGLVEIWSEPDTRHITRRDRREIKRIIRGELSSTKSQKVTEDK